MVSQGTQREDARDAKGGFAVWFGFAGFLAAPFLLFGGLLGGDGIARYAKGGRKGRKGWLRCFCRLRRFFGFAVFAVRGAAGG